MMLTDNYGKHTTKSNLQRYLINRFYDALFRNIENLPMDSVLDVGCGEGFTLERMRTKGLSAKSIGVDYLNRAVEIGKEIHPELDLRIASIYELPFEDNSFGLVICTEVLEHLEMPAEGLKELIRVAKNYVLVSVPNEPFFMLANLLRGKNLSRFGNDVEHIQHWTFFSFRSFLQAHDLRVIRLSLPFPWTMILCQKE